MYVGSQGWAYMNVYVDINTHTAYMYVPTYVCKNVCLHVCVCIYAISMYTFRYAYQQALLYVHTYTYYIHACTYILTSLHRVIHIYQYTYLNVNIHIAYTWIHIYISMSKICVFMYISRHNMSSWSLEVFSGTVHWFCWKTSFHPLLWTSIRSEGKLKTKCLY